MPKKKSEAQNPKLFRYLPPTAQQEILKQESDAQEPQMTFGDPGLWSHLSYPSTKQFKMLSGE